MGEVVGKRRWCGVAAAISAGFNSPIGGMIFAHEAILRHFSFRAIAPIAISSVVSATIANQFFPSGILFQNTNSDISLLPAVSLSLLLGPICALIAVIFMTSLLNLQKNITKISSSEIIRILIAVLICGLLGGFIPEILGLGGETISGILNETYSINFMILVLILKLIVTIVCLSLGFFGGVFSPALVLGASVGCRFANKTVKEIANNSLHSIVATAILVILGLLAAYIANFFVENNLMTLILAFCPGGIYEVAVIAIAFDLEPDFVAFHHIIRLLFILFTVPVFLKVIQKFKK
mgnify:CR=1 FL=1